MDNDTRNILLQKLKNDLEALEAATEGALTEIEIAEQQKIDIMLQILYGLE
jgi:hypothetical protein